jgi:hypothetical protein
MRDINRIDGICDSLKQIWKTLPDWRLMQLIVNFQDYISNDGYYLEDEDFIKALAEMTGVDLNDR